MASEDAIDQLRRGAEDAAYTAVGLGLLALQRAQVRRREMQRQAPGLARALEGAGPRVADALGSAFAAAEDLAGALARHVGTLLGPLVEDDHRVTTDGPASPRGPREASPRD